MEDMFPAREGVDASKLRITREGSYSITRRRDSARILEHMASVVGALDDKIITDTTGCVGGDTINFGLHFKTVHSIEANEENFEALRHNVEAFGLTNVHTYWGDSVRLFQWYSDVMYIDPPWGGPSYRTRRTLELFLSDVRLDKWVEQVLLRANHPKWIALKLPRNYNLGRLQFLPNTRAMHIFPIRTFVLVVISAD